MFGFYSDSTKIRTASTCCHQAQPAMCHLAQGQSRFVMLPPVRSGHETRTENRTTERFNLNCPEINGNGSRRCGRAESVCGDIGDKKGPRRGMVVDKRKREPTTYPLSDVVADDPLPFPPGAGRLKMVGSKGTEGNSTKLRMPKELDLALDCQSRDRWFKSNGER